MAKQLYKLFCVDEENVVKIWTDISPTVCPHNSVHEIALDSVRIDEAFNDIVKTEEATDGYFETEHIEISVPSGTPGDVTEHDVTWPMDILLWKTLITPTSDMIGDSISVLAAPETTVGVATAPINIGDTTINVNSTVTDNTWRGFLITLFDGVNKDVVGRCTAVDTVGGTITFQTPTTYAYAAGSAVKISVYTLKNIYVADTSTIDIGGKGFKGKTITSGMILRVYYTNNSGTAKLMRWRPELYNKG